MKLLITMSPIHTVAVQLVEMALEKVTSSLVSCSGIWCDFAQAMTMCLVDLLAIQFVLSDEFSHMRPEERQQLLHVCC